MSKTTKFGPKNTRNLGIKNIGAICTREGMKVNWVLFVPTGLGYLVLVFGPVVCSVVCPFRLVVWRCTSSFACCKGNNDVLHSSI
jgi:hypothetical protein